MSRALDAVRPEIRKLRAYTFAPVPQGLRAKLDFNEASADVAPARKAEVLARVAARRWALYPEFGAPRLREALAAASGRSPDEVVPGNGSGEVILAAMSVLAGCGGTLLLAPPVFSLYYQMAALVGARVAEVPLAGPAFALDEDAFLAAVAREARPVPLLCSPNNPTGGTVPLAFVRRLAAVAPVVLLDQAYVDFAGEEDDARILLDELDNLVVFRTLSKAYGIAGLRVGYALARTPLAREVAKAVLPFSVDVGAEETALALLADRAGVAARTGEVARERERVAAALRALGARVAPSRANFLFFVPPGGDAPALFRGLRERGVLVRELVFPASSATPSAIRVTIGTPEENDAFLRAFEEVL